jgi:hypothetical protein
MRDDEAVQLRLPADPDMVPIVVAAVGAAVRSARLGTDAIAEAREQAATAFQRGVDAGWAQTVVTIRTRSDGYDVAYDQG